MQSEFSLGLAAALAAGLIFAFVTSIEGFVSKSVGAVNASLLEHTFAGSIAIILIIIVTVQKKIDWGVVKALSPQLILAAFLLLIAVSSIILFDPENAGNKRPAAT